MSRWWLAVMAGASLACGSGRLVPAKSAQGVPGSDNAVFDVDRGLRCSVDSQAWLGRPGDLPEFIAPIKVRLRNATGEPIRIRYEDFALVGKNGRRYLPLPLLPLSSDPENARPTVRPIHFSEKFFVAPKLQSSYPTLLPWTTPLERDEALYADALAKWGDSGPSREVLREGLPEGIVGDGGSVTGFLYFDSPTRRERRLTFEARLEPDGADADRATDIEIPFRVD